MYCIERLCFRWGAEILISFLILIYNLSNVVIDLHILRQTFSSPWNNSFYESARIFSSAKCFRLLWHIFMTSKHTQYKPFALIFYTILWFRLYFSMWYLCSTAIILWLWYVIIICLLSRMIYTSIVSILKTFTSIYTLVFNVKLKISQVTKSDLFSRSVFL